MKKNIKEILNRFISIANHAVKIIFVTIVKTSFILKNLIIIIAKNVKKA